MAVALCNDRDLQYLKELKEVIRESGNEMVQNYILNIEDEVLLMFVRCRKYKISSAFDRIKKLINCRVKKYPKLFNMLYPSALRNPLDNARGRVLKSRDARGSHVFIYKTSKWEPKFVTIEELFCGIFLVAFEMLLQIETQLNGIVIVIDAEDFNARQLIHGSPFNVKKYVDIIVNSAPLKLKAIHVTNGPTIFNAILSLIKKFLSPKLRDRVFAHGSSMELLHEHISPAILPTWLGGSLTDEQALDHKIINNLYTEERDMYYKKLMNLL